MRVSRHPFKAFALLCGFSFFVGCTPSWLVKSDLPPVLPGVIPPGPTVTHPPMTGYVLAGKVTGLKIQQVEAVALSSQKRFDSPADAENTFQFAYLDPCLYQLTLVAPEMTLTLHKVVRVRAEQSLFLNIEVSLDPLAVTVDGVPVAADVN
ncbi:hypothetical protein D3C87_940400 [compost metagenome]